MAETHVQRLGSDPLLKANFLIEIDGIAITGFRTCSGLHRSFAESTHRNGDDPPRMSKQRGIETVDDVTLGESITGSGNELEEWYNSGERKDVSIVELDHLGNEVERHNCFNVWPKDLNLGDKDSMAEDEVGVRELILSMEDFEKA